MSTTTERERPSLSRPLSEISENESNSRRVVSGVSNRSSMHSNKNKSRPVSEVKEDLQSPNPTSNSSSKRMSVGPVQTITLNLVEYAKSQPQSQTQSQSRSQSHQPTLSQPIQSHSTNGGSPPPSPSTKPTPTPPQLPRRPESSMSLNKKGKEKENETVKEKKGSPKLVEKELPETGESSRSGVSSFLLAKRASLRPSSLSISYAEVAKPLSSPNTTSSTNVPTAFDSLESLQSNADTPNKPTTKSKPSWLRRASGTAALRSKSRTPPPKDDSSLPTSTSLPPALPPRKGLESMAEVPTSQSLPEESMAPPPFPPRKSSYASITAAGPSRSRLGEGQGRPAFSPSTSSSSFAGPPPLPPRDNIGNIRGKIAAWTAAAAQSGGGFTRSDSSASLQTQAGSGIGQSQKFPASAQRVLGHAGTAVQKGWAGLRSKGVGGSISSMSSLGQPSRKNGFEPSGSWGSGLGNRGSRDRSRSDNYEFGAGAIPSSDGPVFEIITIKRSSSGQTGKVFGRDIVDAGKEWGGTEMDEEGLTEWERRRRKCLPAVLIRSVEYLQMWGPKEEGIFRISGRSSHIARLRKEFDSGADIDLVQCHPGDLDPHAVAGLFKSYLRELPSPLLTNHLVPRFEAYAKGKGKAVNRAPLVSDLAEDGQRDEQENLKSLVDLLPQAHWFLLADIVMLLDLIPRHSATNRMTQNALMLSLGPSLNISGSILNELIEKREVLFAEPPSPTGMETAISLIDFGDVSPVTPLSEIPPALHEDQSAPPSIIGSAKSKKAPRLPAKPSLTKLFTSSHISLPRQKSVDTLHSIINTEPPRVDLPISPTSPLPTFESQQPIPDLHDNDKTPKPTLEAVSNTSAAAVPLPDTPVSNASEKMEDQHYPSGTVDERAKLFSTPIADKFQSTSSPFPPLRAPRSSNGSTLSVHSSTSDGHLSRTANSDSNPASIVRRGAPVFFSSAGVERQGSHSRSASASAAIVLNGSGIKRKDGQGDERDIRASSEESEGRTKRLSAGLDNPRVREFTV
ncbi:uncharacterized protein IL334_002683 [Kwoniella shivajii]|uniref:Rho-GAP domain-containing protein n=1 Tax=Kwoniella shivajii TaxID=564305 RepID=A0ABZ1CX49_9TREE|nr:hypothetical protein IL334_002683 [Kwoniella shivajii]